MYSAMRVSALLGVRTSASQPTGGSGSPVDRARLADDARSLSQHRRDDRDRLARRGAYLSDQALVPPAHRELDALGRISYRREVFGHLHGGLVESRCHERIDI